MTAYMSWQETLGFWRFWNLATALHDHLSTTSLLDCAVCLDAAGGYGIILPLWWSSEVPILQPSSHARPPCSLQFFSQKRCKKVSHSQPWTPDLHSATGVQNQKKKHGKNGKTRFGKSSRQRINLWRSFGAVDSAAFLGFKTKAKAYWKRFAFLSMESRYTRFCMRHPMDPTSSCNFWRIVWLLGQKHSISSII